MKFTMEVEMDNAAFDRGDGRELSRILRLIENKLCAGETSGKCMDLNGNKVGSWEID